MNALIVELDGLICNRRPEFYASLRQGVSDLVLDEFEQDFGHPLPILFRELYRWRDGQAPSEFANFDSFNNAMFMCLEGIKATMKDMRELLEYGDIGSDMWSTNWLPFLANGGGNHLCLDFSCTTETPVVYHDHEVPAGDQIASNTEEWLRALITEYHRLKPVTYL